MFTMKQCTIDQLKWNLHNESQTKTHRFQVIHLGMKGYKLRIFFGSKLSIETHPTLVVAKRRAQEIWAEYIKQI